MARKMKNKSAKRGSIANKIILIVALSVIISSSVSLFLVLSSARTQLRKTIQNGMINVTQTSADLIIDKMHEVNKTELNYTQFSEVLDGLKVTGVDSSYVYVVGEDGTMLYHPTEDKVGQPVENVVVKGLTKKIESGEIPEPDTAEYDFKGVMKYASYEVLDNHNIVVVSADESDALAGISSVTKVALAIEAIIILLAVIFAYIFGKMLAKPLVKVSGLIEEIADGNIMVDFSVVRKSNDEIGLIVERMQNMTNSLGEIVTKIREASGMMSENSSKLNATSEQTMAANDEIAKAVEDVAEGSTKMAVSISSINDHIGDMNKGTQVIDSSVVNIKQQTATVQKNSRGMSDKMRNMHASSEKMDESIETISSCIERVNAVVDRVGDIISVIEDISGQTSLLSLNASIEAARAGEAGKGFAVVADEIRVLSDNTNTELNRIREIIEQLEEECNACVAASKVIVSDNAVQRDEIADVLREFRKLDEQIAMTAEKADEIQSLVSNMVDLNGDITNSSGGLTDVSSSNAAATEEMTANIEELNAMMHGVADMAGVMNSQSKELNEALNYFKI